MARHEDLDDAATAYSSSIKDNSSPPTSPCLSFRYSRDKADKADDYDEDDDDHPSRLLSTAVLLLALLCYSRTGSESL